MPTRFAFLAPAPLVHTPSATRGARARARAHAAPTATLRRTHSNIHLDWIPPSPPSPPPTSTPQEGPSAVELWAQTYGARSAASAPVVKSVAGGSRVHGNGTTELVGLKEYVDRISRITSRVAGDQQVEETEASRSQEPAPKVDPPVDTRFAGSFKARMERLKRVVTGQAPPLTPVAAASGSAVPTVEAALDVVREPVTTRVVRPSVAEAQARWARLSDHAHAVGGGRDAVHPAKTEAQGRWARLFDHARAVVGEGTPGSGDYSLGLRSAASAEKKIADDMVPSSVDTNVRSVPKTDSPEVSEVGEHAMEEYETGERKQLFLGSVPRKRDETSAGGDAASYPVSPSSANSPASLGNSAPSSIAASGRETAGQETVPSTPVTIVSERVGAEREPDAKVRKRVSSKKNKELVGAGSGTDRFAFVAADGRGAVALTETAQGKTMASIDGNEQVLATWSILISFIALCMLCGERFPELLQLASNSGMLM